jgi:hypothetical protein
MSGDTYTLVGNAIRYQGYRLRRNYEYMINIPRTPIAVRGCEDSQGGGNTLFFMCEDGVIYKMYYYDQQCRPAPDFDDMKRLNLYCTYEIDLRSDILTTSS